MLKSAYEWSGKALISRTWHCSTFSKVLWKILSFKHYVILRNIEKGVCKKSASRIKDQSAQVS